MQQAFIFDTAPFAAAHASTIAETPDGLVVAWFGGTREGHSDVRIWLSRRRDGQWSAPESVADGVASRLKRFPCWNPVLFQVPGGPLLLFYKVGPSPSRWWGMMMRSTDGGSTWSEPERLPEGIYGPIKNKPVLRADCVLLCPSSCERHGWRVHMEYTGDLGKTWRRGPPLNQREAFAAIQPTILNHADGGIQLLCRSRQGAITECWSSDGGETWSKMQPTELPNPDSGIDGVNLADGRGLLVYNHAAASRSPLNVIVSDDGVHWHALAVLEEVPGEFSYPAVIAGSCGRIHITYTWNRRRIRHVVLDPADVEHRPIESGLWPA
ncbi:conserved hypothetical protein [uncultured Defluviicoccus sp.]|uniref:Sialidase domain-containing protein n=1 Tax=metagenome TaxID=256318 RepID=A0A380TK36_9ZZZZ|nr:conserved hypothetical protein [uncultured Defluviicoccus sp.]